MWPGIQRELARQTFPVVVVVVVVIVVVVVVVVVVVAILPYSGTGWGSVEWIRIDRKLFDRFYILFLICLACLDTF